MLTQVQKQAIKLDFEEWTGGFTPTEASEAEIQMYVDGACAVIGVNEHEVEQFLNELLQAQ